MAEPNTRKGSAEDPPAPTTDAPAVSVSTPDAGTPEPETTRPETTEPGAGSDEPSTDNESASTRSEPAAADPEPTEPEPTRPEPVPAARPEPAGAERRSVPRVPVLALGGLLVVLLIGAGLLGWHQYRAAQVQDDRAAAMKAALDLAGNLTTITSDNFDGQIDALSRISTDTFKEQMSGYAAMFGALVKQGNMSLRGKVTSAGLEKLEGDTASALVTLSTVITSGQQPDGVPRTLGLLVSLQRDGDNWLASKVEYLR